MTTRSVATEFQRDDVVKLIKSRKLPFTISLTSGRKRSVEQNKLQRLWVKEIAEQLGDRTSEQVRGDCKLRFGVPILREDSDDFREKYDRIFKPLPYETKLELCMEPFDFPVTRLMKVGQLTKYLESIARHYAEQGVELTQPIGGI